MHRVADEIFGYTYGSADVPPSPVTLADLDLLNISVGLIDADRRNLPLAGEVLAPHTRQIVQRWRSDIIASIPHLARHSRTPDGAPIPAYLASSNLRFEQWILDTCFRPYDQDWLNYQHEIARRHTTAKKNQVDGVRSTPFVPFRDVVAFTAVMNQTLKPYLATAGHSAEEVERMHQAWCKSLQLQTALWARAYFPSEQPILQW